MHDTLLGAAPEWCDCGISSAGMSAQAWTPPCQTALSMIPNGTIHALAECHRSATIDDQKLMADIIIVVSCDEW